eukprot:m.254251 g.254251  ORF g.254251 m.254251 type:complete len:74 (-) comp17825_c0_seq1:1265-1486(-)
MNNPTRIQKSLRVYFFCCLFVCFLNEKRRHLLVEGMLIILLVDNSLVGFLKVLGQNDISILADSKHTSLLADG